MKITLIIALSIFIMVVAYFCSGLNKFSWPYDVDCYKKLNNRLDVINASSNLAMGGVIFIDMYELKGFDVFSKENGQISYDQIIIYYKNEKIDRINLSHINRYLGILSFTQTIYKSAQQVDAPEPASPAR